MALSGTSVSESRIDELFVNALKYSVDVSKLGQRPKITADAIGATREEFIELLRCLRNTEIIYRELGLG